jgi:predicted transporter
MKEFSILTNRKRALVALVHSIVFLVIASCQMVLARPAAGISIASPANNARSSWLLCGIFALVSGILIWLLIVSRGWIEKLYFGLCSVSACSGLLRTAAGDSVFHVGVYIRVIMLMLAVVAGFFIVRAHSNRRVRLESQALEVCN